MNETTYHNHHFHGIKITFNANGRFRIATAFRMILFSLAAAIAALVFQDTVRRFEASRQPQQDLYL